MSLYIESIDTGFVPETPCSPERQYVSITMVHTCDLSFKKVIEHEYDLLEIDNEEMLKAVNKAIDAALHYERTRQKLTA